MEPTYRQTEPVCTYCPDRAETACERCGTPLCSAHKPQPDTRCPACEAEFSSRPRPLWWLLLAVPLLLIPGLVLFSWALTAQLQLSLAVVVVLDAIIVLGGAILVASWPAARERRARRRFLAEKKPR